ncbi:probable LRR receptor-like serine/threonine-protein kinase At1g56140 isoform X1 [Magnolia sinica]|uniref:probable LRR receptor-like serine/threonine-protein kinase At1g56140 isoform X1 n=1 Tax=Magnolia sinica TaxID=86752 RepID=UPI0026585B0D|nr:probable LRR receptor-like serine/threonine-protein kinase At1g56140 isoform X1 [Magnolia sinica]
MLSEFLRMGPRPNTFSYTELKTPTEDFNPANKLGQGGFGIVFKESKLHLDWHTRFEICLGITRGLAYLHEETRPCIVHRDV